MQRRTVIVIPDLHGRLDLLETAVQYADIKAERGDWHDPHFLSLGDAIDRGPNSVGCVKRLLELRSEGRATLLMGNHERMALEGPQHYERFRQTGEARDLRAALGGLSWWMNAGGNTVRRELDGITLEDFPQFLRDYLDHLLHMVFVDEAGGIHNLPPATPSVMVTHASPPKVNHEYADPMEAALWLRPHDGPFELPPSVSYSVHGHTPVRVVVQRDQQVYLDLAAYKTGRLALLPIDVNSPSGLVVLEGEGRPEAAEKLPAFGKMLPAKLRRISV